MGYSEEKSIKEKAIIYHKQSKRQLSQYHHQVNTAAQEICLKNPSMLAKKGELLTAAQDLVMERGYKFKKGQDLKKIISNDEQKSKKLKINKDLRTQRMDELKEDIKDCNDNTF